ncbi:MAG: HAMP domain-containing histidine kinase [Anaerolineae bacterium]|nr:HAMP domain-containing histidine kinase [Anaerolineae bacterium]
MVLLLDTPDWETASAELLEQQFISTNGTSYSITPKGTAQLTQPNKPGVEKSARALLTEAPAQEAVPVPGASTHPFLDYLVAFNHDLRSPLNSVIGFSRVILKGIDGEINEMQAEDLQSIYDSGQRLLGMLTEIVDMARLETGVLSAQCKPVALEALFEKLIGKFEEEGANKPVTFHSTLPPDGLEVRTDESRLEQILTNVTAFCLRNLDIGSIFLRGNFHQGDKIYVEVEDTGSGWSPGETAVLLDAYRAPEQVHHIGGAGLSLAIAHRLAELLGGTLTVESRVGKGTTFRLVLPQDPPPGTGSSEKEDG